MFVKSGVKDNRRRRVLVVDDEIINRMLLGNIVSSRFDVLYAENGKEALDIMRSEDSLSLVLLDLLMPVMDGKTLLAEVKDDPAFRNLPIVVLTSETEAEVESIRLGAMDFIKKPYDDPEVILARIQRIIELYEDRRLIETVEFDGTGLYTKDFFLEYMQIIDEQVSGLTDVIALDIDHFRLVNEIHGRQAGDEVLKKIGQRVGTFLKDRLGIGCHWDADQYYVYCEHIEEEEEIEDFVRDLSDFSDIQNIHLRCGVYCVEDRSVELDKRISSARYACNTLRNNYHRSVAYYDVRLHNDEVFAERLISDMDKAFENKEFKVYMQPKYDIRGEEPKIVAAEALVRWKHPEFGMVSPGRFIPLFEGNGLVQRLDNYIWDETARIISYWKDTYGKAVPVSVNVSRIDLYDPQLKEKLLDIVKRHKLSMNELRLEVTESAYTEDENEMVGIIRSLQEEGFAIEMDDFGAGFSSLNMLSSMPINALKLDMRFARTIDTDPKQHRVVECIIDFSKYLDVVTIAEGVENEAQYQAMKEAGCDIVQGYYFSRPLPEEEFETLIKTMKEE